MADFAASALHAFEREVFSDLTCHGADFAASALHAFERVSLPLLVAPIALMPLLEGADVSFVQHLFELLEVS